MGAHVAEGKTLSLDQTAMLAYPQVSEIRHVHHAGNSSGVVDGAGAVLVASSDYAKAHGLPPRARIVQTAVAGTEPVIMLTAPGPATKRCLEKAGMTIDDIDLIEVNEAFAAVVLKFLRDTGADWDKCNVNGGAMALGHPIGATGSMLIGTVLDELERRDLTHRPGHDVHRRRHGHRHDHRAGVAAPTSSTRCYESVVSAASAAPVLSSGTTTPVAEGKIWSGSSSGATGTGFGVGSLMGATYPLRRTVETGRPDGEPVDRQR